MKRGVTIPKSDVAFDAHQFPRALTYTSIYLADTIGASKSEWAGDLSAFSRPPPPPSHGQTNGPKRQNDRRGGRMEGWARKKKREDPRMPSLIMDVLPNPCNLHEMLQPWGPFLHLMKARPSTPSCLSFLARRQFPSPPLGGC
ncbi:hypothetical protein CDAR_40141 [Caerostris darwini]|uniref:Uncharacterized protein n=1 Tax=Caerostris darwini TaxID=1538125 RepID=A0AAV4R9V0_9ARAC|nr:hypothetical protein CDAR_40141 [Caerostris darwini]